jgi:hypothetical protein
MKSLVVAIDALGRIGFEVYRHGEVNDASLSLGQTANALSSL